MNTTLKTLGLITVWAILNPIAYAKQTCKDNIPHDTPTERFSENADDSVTDKVTTLIWKRCSVGQRWNAGTKRCDGTATTHNWQQALTLAQNAGDGWRLPNIKEFNSIVERACYNPAINDRIFPDTVVIHGYWSSSPFASYANHAWGVDFNDGVDYGVSKSNSRYVRLVRGGQ